MTYKRKTIDTWELHVNYGQGWEHECTEFSLADGRKQMKTYRENCPEWLIKLVLKRMKPDEGNNG